MRDRVGVAVGTRVGGYCWGWFGVRAGVGVRAGAWVWVGLGLGCG